MNAERHLRITQVMLSKGFGGGERYFVDLVCALADAGHTVQALCHARYTGLKALSARENVEVTTTNLRGLWDAPSVRGFACRVAGFAPDVIHAHMARGAWAGGKVVLRHGGCLVATTHNYVNLKYYYQVHTFIPTTRDQASYLARSGVPPGRVVRIPNFSALEPVSEVATLENDGITFVAMGRFVPKKGFGVLLEALSLLRANGVDAQLVLGGSGPEERRLRRLAERLGVARSVRFAGWIDDVSAFLSSGDAFVLPSLDEPFGIVILEAMAAGRPIVTSRSKGPSEILDDDTAWFADVGNPMMLAEGMAALANDTATARRKAERALQRYRDRYSANVVVPRIESLYRKVIANIGGPALAQ